LSKHVQIWAPGQPINADVLLYLSCDEAAFSIVKTAVNGNTKVFKILPNGYKFAELIRTYWYLVENPTHEWIDTHGHQIPHQYIWMIRNFARLSFALQHWDDRSAEAAINLLLKDQTVLHPDHVRFLNYCSTFITKVFRPLIWGAPIALDVATTVTRARAWWKSPSALSNEIGVHLNDLHVLSNNLRPIANSVLLFWLRGVKNRLDSNLSAPAPTDALREASAMCHALAKINFSSRRYSLAVLFCHRAADLLLFSECSAAGLINFMANHGGGEYKNPIDGKNIGLLDSHEALVNNGSILPNTIRRNRFTHLNQHRNHLILTHYFGSSSQTAASTLLTETTLELQAIGGTAWDLARNSVLQPIVIPERFFLEVSDGFTGMFVPG
jgi:hypothetical protein